MVPATRSAATRNFFEKSLVTDGDDERNREESYSSTSDSSDTRSVSSEKGTSTVDAESTPEWGTNFSTMERRMKPCSTGGSRQGVISCRNLRSQARKLEAQLSASRRKLESALTCSDDEPARIVGMYAGREKANPLKYLAGLLRRKLEKRSQPCSVLEIATEIHNEAKNKHNTTLRRIYDVVNVLEAAGVIERTGGSISSRKKLGPSYSNPRARHLDLNDIPTPDVLVVTNHDRDSGHHDVQSASGVGAFESREHSNAYGKRRARGSDILWIGVTSETTTLTAAHLQYLQKEKEEAMERISKKQQQLESLREQLRVTTELLTRNRRMQPCCCCRKLHVPNSTAVCQSPSMAHYNPDFKRKELQEVGTKETRGDSTSITSDIGVDDWYLSDTAMSLPENADIRWDVLPPTAPLQVARLALDKPFLVFRTRKAAHVEILINEKYPPNDHKYEVCLALDDEFHLYEPLDILHLLFPAKIPQ